MSSTDGDQRRIALRRVLANDAGDGADAGAVADATVGIWLQISGRLSTVIGERGVSVLFKRALQTTSRTFPWLAVDNNDDSAVVLPSLRQCLAGRDAAIAEDAGHALLVSFTDLLASLIGASLADRLLSPVWAPPAAATDKENTA
jgi:hypothetical protein